MSRMKVDNFKHVVKTNHLMRNGGLLLVTEGKDGKPNAMTIGWGFLGTMWRRPFFVVAVRLSRHTHKLLEESDSFTVCLPGKGMDNVLEVCGTKSGRDMAKFKELGLNVVSGEDVKAPYIKECPVHYECEIAYKDHVEDSQLPKEIEDDAYPNKNWHVLYYGEVKGAYEVADAGSKLA